MENPYAGQGPVLLDIGDDVGALVVFGSAGLSGQEIEIRPRSREGPATPRRAKHVSVLPRGSIHGTRFVAVFGGLPAGDYELSLLPAGPVRLTVRVIGGEVTEADWPD